MSKWTYLIIVLFGLTFDPAKGRLTEITTERLPILSHNLHEANIELKALYRRVSLGPRSELKFKNWKFHPTAKGVKRVRLVQAYAGYEVLGPSAVAELNMDGHLTGHMYGELALDLHKDIPNPEACVRDVQALLDKAVRLEKLNPADPKIEKRHGERAIYADSDKRKAKIIYVVEFLYRNDKVVSNPVYYIDACSTSVMFSFDRIKTISLSDTRKKLKTMEKKMEDFNLRGVIRSKLLKFKSERVKSNISTPCVPSIVGTGGNPNTGQINYNSEPYCLPAQKDGFTCTMEGTYATVVDNFGSDKMDKKTPVSFDCTAGYSDPVNGAFGVANDALFYSEVTGQFFMDTYNTEGLDYKIRVVVHYDEEYDNAFSYGSDIYFGDGKDKFYPLVYLDVYAHEYAHAITTKNSDLIYFGMSGGINEAFSDITSIAIYFYMTGSASWSIGAKIDKNGEPLRFFDDPTKDGRSIKNAWRFRPFMNVHRTSGVFNYAFYHMVHTYNIPMYSAYAAFLNSNLVIWGKFTRFRKGACNVVQAGYDAGSDYKSMSKAFRKSWLFLLRQCKHQALKTTLFPGETREDILVSRDRSPILEIDMNHWAGSGVEATITDNSNSAPIWIVVTTDGDAEDIIAYGENRVEFPENHTRLHVKLMSEHEQDIKVTLRALI